MFEWFKTQAVDEAAQRIASELASRLPASQVGNTAKKAEAKQRKSIDLALRQAQAFAASQRLNLFTRSRFANRVKWNLIEAGYPRAFVDDLAYELAVVVAQAKLTATA